jgi:hypothetical protein
VEEVGVVVVIMEVEEEVVVILVGEVVEEVYFSFDSLY